MGRVTLLQLWASLALLCGCSLAAPLGKEFVTAFMQNYQLSYSKANFKLFITAYSSPTSVTIWMNKSSFKQVLTVNERTTATVEIPANAELPGVSLSCNVIGVKADKDISVLAMNYKALSADTTVVYPLEGLGTDYYAVTPLDGPSDAFKELSVISAQESTSVDVFLKGGVTYQEKRYPAGSKLTVVLDPYSVLQLLSSDDLSGSRIVSQKPVAVLSGHTCTWKNTKCNHVYEQLRPVTCWGSSFIIPPIFLQTKSDIVFVVASADNTKIEYQVQEAKKSQTLNAGQVVLLELPVKTPIYLTASAGIQVVYYCTGWQDKFLVQYDPILMNIPPISAYCSSYYIYGQQEFNNYGTLVAKTADVSRVTVDKGPAQGLTWANIPGTDYSWAAESLGKGFTFQLTENTSPFLLLSFGLLNMNSYGSPAICIKDNAGSPPTCSNVKCRAKEKCQMVNGKPVCIPDSEAYCHAVGDPHYRTFDGYFYDFQGTCSYTIAKTCNGDKDLPTFNIEAKNENRGSTRVAYVSYVNVQVYEQTISLVRYEYGFVRVNNQRQRLPINLNEGQIRLYQSGSSVVIETDFSLKVFYDWNSILKVYVSSSFFGSVCGLCGNYNGNPSDDLMTPDGVKAATLLDFGKSWKVEDGDRFCWHNCNGECKACPLDTQQKYGGELNCGLLSKVLNGPFAKCHSVLDPKTYVDNCVYDLCMNDGSKQILCQSLKTYAEACQRSKVDIGEWRSLAGCPMQCPANSEYKLCSKACPATCNDDATPSVCADQCVESCQCKEGFVLDEGKCVPKANCGCVYQGKLYAPNENFWGDKKCEQQCTCNPTTKKVECKATRCKSSETCSVVNGIQNCYPVSYGTCSASGDPHYVSFDGLRFDFQGTCIYQFAGLCKKSDDLIDFQVNVQNEFRGSKVVSYTSAVQVKLCDFDISIQRQYKDRILVNGLLTNLPFVVDNGKLSIYKQGYSAILQTSFGLRVTYNWDSYISVTLPSTYAGAVCGLCGNFDGKKENDLTMKNNQLTTKPLLFGNSWKVQNVPGCYEEDKGDCTKLAQLELFHNNNKQGCGILKDKTGPFRECHAKINPDGPYSSCVYDACFYENKPDVICKIVAAYAKQCQDAGVTIYPWRTNKFCSPTCPKNSHYEVCASGCAPTCLSLSPPLGCNPICAEGCQCDDGFILSGGDCVPISKCGCRYNDKYYKTGEVFYPSGLCNQKCVCTESGVVQCNAFTCGPNEECKVIDGVQKCQPVGSAQCSAAGDPHYMSFDGRAFDFQGTCTYTLSKTVTNNANLVPFAINVKNEKWGNGLVAVTKLVSFEVYGYNLILQYEVRGRILINGVYNNIPVNLEDGKIRVYQHGIRVIIDTDFGVQVNYDLVYHVIVTAPGNYKNQLGGLCGNYNSDKQDDFQLPDKSVTTDATAFGSSWKVQIPGVTCDNGCGGSGNPCPSCDDKKKEIFKTENYCGFLKKPGGPLSACYGTINPDTYFNNCIYDLCASVGNGDILCQSIHSYVAACQAAGVTIQPWRTDAFCPLTCPANSKYKVCADVCSSTCAGVTDPAKCPETCSEGCECNDGFFFDGNNCVSIDKCGCFEDGKYYQPNEKVLSNDCKQACTCSPVGGLICEDTGCAADEECKIQGGAVKCINKDPCKSITCRVKETCKIQNGNAVCVPDFTGTCWAWGDPHYHTFDGYNYDFQGTCTYILSKYDGKDAGLVPFTIEEKNDNRGSQAVSYVRTVNIYVYGNKITLMKGEFGKVRVNDVITNLPVNLLDGKISISISGLNAVFKTDFGLQVTYEYNWHVVVSLTSSYYGLTLGLCGNFNEKINDELITSDNKVVTKVLDWAKSWKVNDRDPFCFDYCPGLNCPTCDDAKKGLYGGENKCGLISKVATGPFRECHSKVNPDNFFDSCLYDVCINNGANQFLCQALNAYASTCRKEGAKIYDWRTPSGCVLPCPANSHYEFCGNACPATCTDRTAPSRCTEDCVETCQCNDGFVLSVDKCVPISSCGCSYKGTYYQANEEFWADENCRSLCKCDPNLGMVVCKESSCKPSERCMVTNGVRGCQPLSYSTCTGSGDPHYTTFDGKRFDFMGTCIYQLVGVSSSDSSLTRFNVKVQNNNRGGNKAVSYTKVVTLEVYDRVFTLSMDYPRRILVDGVVTSLPFYFQTNKVVAYISGGQGIIKTDFDVTIKYDWQSYVAVTIPSTYTNAVQGLCGNNNKNSNDDFNMKDGKPAASAVAFGNSWKVGDVDGCTPECTGSCPLCTEAQKQAYKGDNYCGLITKAGGPFSRCLSVVDPKPYFDDCIYDACQYKGHPSSFCKAIGLYVDACQSAGVALQEWRKPNFCSMSCPINTHYELCGDACPVTCNGLSSPTGCDSPCKEACYCDNGFILSGHKCVPIQNCGCVYQDKYYQKNEVFYPQGQCSQKCQCGADGVVKCQSEACSPEEECKLVNGAWGCQPKEYGRCVASGDPHYISFDGLRFDFQGTCTYTLSKLVVNDSRLVDFSVIVENESYGNGKVAVTRLVVVYVYGYVVAIERDMRSKVKVNGEFFNLPLSLEDDNIVINQEGANVVLQTDFGLKILYDTIYGVVLYIPSSYRGKIGGLCGNFNGDNKDEFQLPNKQVVKNVNDFGASWKVNIAGAKCSDGCEEGVCPVCNEAKLQPYKATSSCGMITDPAGPFKACHSKIDPNNFFTHCAYDACAVDGKDNIVCKSLQAYAAACHTVGATIGSWRTPAFCPMSCPANSHYELCTRTCEQTCSGLTSPTKCTDRCFEGCQCNDGYILDGDTCSTMDKCGCVFSGRYLSEGESFLSADCRQQCKCQAGGVTCTDNACGDKERCGLVNGVRGCFKTESECTVSQQKFVTYDGLSGGPIGNGPIEVTSLCNSDSAGWFRVLADIQVCAGAATSVARLHIFHRQGLVTISKNKEIWINGLPDVFPVTSSILSASAKDTSVSIQIGANLKIEFSNTGSVSIRVLQGLSEVVCGACGNFNGNSSDDLRSPAGKAVTNIIELVKSWSARDLNSCNT
ncbi:IgGFc-binding protein-like [Aquarana catesbeiana]|uniref:IgGFc-binding protein-like n=1 Tax=Aquarana catesbeiana TaxID=8400 RepID=UPI003CCA1583